MDTITKKNDSNNLTKVSDELTSEAFKKLENEVLKCGKSFDNLNAKYKAVLTSLETMTGLALEATERSAAAASKAAMATIKDTQTARLAATNGIVVTAVYASQAAVTSADAAIEAAGAANAAGAVTAIAASHHEAALLKAATESAEAIILATESAVTALRMSQEAEKHAKLAKNKK